MLLVMGLLNNLIPFVLSTLVYIVYFRILETAGANKLLLVTFLMPVSAILLVVAILDGVGNIECPVAGFFGNEDGSPSPEDVDELDVAPAADGKDFELHRYDDARHAFQNFANEKCTGRATRRAPETKPSPPWTGI